MDYKAPFLALPDYRKNLVLELLPGIPASGAIPDTSENSNNAARTGCTRDKTLALIPVLTFGIGDELTIPFHSSLNIGSGVQTIIAWIRCNTPLATAGSIWSCSGSNSANIFLGVRTVSAGDRMYGYLMSDAEADEIEPSGGDHLPDEEWLMVVYQFDAGNNNLKFYIYDLSQERLLSKNQVTVGSFTLSNSIHIGIDTGDMFQFIGSMAMIRQYNVVLTEVQLKNIYQYTRRHIIGVSPKI